MAVLSSVTVTDGDRRRRRERFFSGTMKLEVQNAVALGS
jgi:hypothetical protein